MSTRAVSWTAVSLVALTFAGCGGNADAQSDRQASATTSTTVAPTTTATIPPPYSFDGSVPPPELINTGTDYEAIYRSLDAYARWLEAHNPDDVLADDAYVVGTPTFQGFVDDLAILTDKRWRLVDVETPADVRVVQARESFASLHVTEHLSRIEARDETGNVTEQQTFSAPLEWLVLLTADSAGFWHIASVAPKEPS